MRHLARGLAAASSFVLVTAALALGTVRSSDAAATAVKHSAVRSDPAPPSALVSEVDEQLAGILRRVGFTGRVESTLEQRLGRKVNRKLADLGRLLWFDTLTGLNDDNTCGGCHSPTNGFGDTQSIAIGVDNNAVVGPNRTGPRNQRRSPLAINTAFYPNLMWNSRFASLTNDPFDNRAGFLFPPPEGLTLSSLPHLLVAQAFIPPSERNEVAGFVFPGDNFDIRAEVLRRLNAAPSYRTLFGRSFSVVKSGGPITFDMFGRAIAEFEFTLVFADAPLDHFARGERRIFVRRVYLNRFFGLRIVGLPEAESQALIDRLCRQAEVVEYQCRFQWAPGSIAFWDHRAVQHHASSDYRPARRVMERATIIGDRPV